MLTSLTGAILSEGNGAYARLGIMLFCSLMGLIATLYVLQIDRREHQMNPA